LDGALVGAGSLKPSLHDLMKRILMPPLSPFFSFSFTPKLNHGKKKLPDFHIFTNVEGVSHKVPLQVEKRTQAPAQNCFPYMYPIFGVIKHWRNSQSVFGGHFSCVNIPPMIEKGILHAFRSGRNLTPTNNCEKNLVLIYSIRTLRLR
jgi:hypothetical protein